MNLVHMAVLSDSIEAVTAMVGLAVDLIQKSSFWILVFMVATIGNSLAHRRWLTILSQRISTLEAAKQDKDSVVGTVSIEGEPDGFELLARLLHPTTSITLKPTKPKPADDEVPIGYEQEPEDTPTAVIAKPSEVSWDVTIQPVIDAVTPADDSKPYPTGECKSEVQTVKLVTSTPRSGFSVTAGDDDPALVEAAYRVARRDSAPKADSVPLSSVSRLGDMADGATGIVSVHSFFTDETGQLWVFPVSPVLRVMSRDHVRIRRVTTGVEVLTWPKGHLRPTLNNDYSGTQIAVTNGHVCTPEGYEM